MQYFNVFILILLIGFNACVREEITDINTIETEDPINVTGAFFKGIVYNGNIKIANAEIEVYENFLMMVFTKCVLPVCRAPISNIVFPLNNCSSSDFCKILWIILNEIGKFEYKVNIFS